MRGHIIESTSQGLWMKIGLVVMDDDDWQIPSALPDMPEPYKERPLLGLLGGVPRNQVWILDYSTGEGIGIDLNEDPEYQIAKTTATI